MASYTGAYKQKDEKYLKKIILSLLPNEPLNVKSSSLSYATGINSRDVRLIIQKLRDDGHPICGTPHKGYWIARTSFDMDETMKKLESHIKSCQDTLESLSKAQRNLIKKEYKEERENYEYTNLLV